MHCLVATLGVCAQTAFTAQIGWQSLGPQVLGIGVAEGVAIGVNIGVMVGVGSTWALLRISC